MRLKIVSEFEKNKDGSYHNNHPCYLTIIAAYGTDCLSNSDNGCRD